MSDATESELAAFVSEAPISRTLILDFVSGFARDTPRGARVLDAGAGTAPYRRLFDHCEYVAHDWSRSVHGTDSVRVVGDLHERLALEPGTFDAVLCTEVLEHVRDADLVLLRLRELLRPGGRLGVTVPFVGPLHEEPDDHRRFTNHGLESAARRAGFVAIDVRPLSGWFSMLALVLLEQGLATQDPRTPPRFFDRVVAGVFRLLSRGLARVAPALDRRLDRRRALPIGWTLVAEAGRPDDRKTA